MPHYLVSGYFPDNFDPSSMTEATVDDINALNDELEAAGARHFAGGLSAPNQAKTLRLTPSGEVLITDGPYLEAKEHVVVCRSSKPLTWTRRWRGAASLSKPAGCRSRCVRSHTATCRPAHLTRRANTGESREPPPAKPAPPPRTSHLLDATRPLLTLQLSARRSD
jgi:hypothetical protein